MIEIIVITIIKSFLIIIIIIIIIMIKIYDYDWILFTEGL